MSETFESQAEASVLEHAPTVAGKAAPWLKPYHFKCGDENPSRINPRAHRPKGSKNATTIYLESLPIKARQWVKSRHASVLIDARKIALPIESDTPTASSTDALVVWFADQLTQAQRLSPTTRIASSDAEQANPNVLPPTLTPSAATETCHEQV